STADREAGCRAQALRRRRRRALRPRVTDFRPGTAGICAGWRRERRTTAWRALPQEPWAARANSFGWRRRGARSILHSAEVFRQSPPSADRKEAPPMPTPAEKRATFRKLHAQGCFVIPNPWDVRSARYLQGLGFKALATTSSGFAFTQGCPDGAVAERPHTRYVNPRKRPQSAHYSSETGKRRWPGRIRTSNQFVITYPALSRQRMHVRI